MKNTFHKRTSNFFPLPYYNNIYSLHFHSLTSSRVFSVCFTGMSVAFMHLSLLSRRGGRGEGRRPGIGGGFDLKSFFLFKCPTTGKLSLVKRVQIPHAQGHYWSARRQPEVECFLFWRVFQGSSLTTDGKSSCWTSDVIASKRSKKEKFYFRLPSVSHGISSL